MYIGRSKNLQAKCIAGEGVGKPVKPRALAFLMYEYIAFFIVFLCIYSSLTFGAGGGATAGYKLISTTTTSREKEIDFMATR